MKTLIKKLLTWLISKQANAYEDGLKTSDALELSWAGL